MTRLVHYEVVEIVRIILAIKSDSRIVSQRLRCMYNNKLITTENPRDTVRHTHHANRLHD